MPSAGRCGDISSATSPQKRLSRFPSAHFTGKLIKVGGPFCAGGEPPKLLHRLTVSLLHHYC